MTKPKHVTTKTTGWWLLLIAGSVAALACFQLNEGDVFLHLRNGQYIVEHRMIPRTDPFTFTASGADWINHEWLYGVLIYGLYSVGGYSGLTSFKIIVLVATFSLLFRLASRQTWASGWIAAVTVLAAAACRFRFFARPHVLTYWFVTLSLYLFRSPIGNSRSVLLIYPCLLVVWANIHAGSVMGLALLIVIILTELPGVRALGRPIDCSPPRTKTLPNDPKVQRSAGYESLGYHLVLLPLSLIAMLINPNGYKIFGYGLQVSDYTSEFSIREWESLGTLTRSPFILILTAAAIYALLRYHRELDLVTLFCFLGSGAAAVWAQRHIEFYCLFAVPAVGVPLSSALRVQPTRLRLLHSLIPIAAIGLILWTSFCTRFSEPPRTYTFGLGINEELFPRALGDFIQAHRIQGRFYNDSTFGGFISFTWPDQPLIFADTRAEVFARVVREVETASFGGMLDKHGISYAIIDNSDTDNVVRDFFLEHKSAWALVWYRDYCLLFVRRIPDYADLIAGTETNYFNLHFNFWTLSKRDRNLALKEFARRAESFSGIAYDHLALCALYRLDGRFTDAETALSQALEIEHHSPTPFLIGADLYLQWQRWHEALAMTRKARQRNAPAVTQGLQTAQAYWGLGQRQSAISVLDKLIRSEPDNPVVRQYLNRYRERGSGSNARVPLKPTATPSLPPKGNPE